MTLKRTASFAALCALLITALCPMRLPAQCLDGELEFFLEVHTDNWGYECYWELTPGGNLCGVGTIATGGNITEMNCGSAGVQTATNDQGYLDNVAIMEGPWCLLADADYTVHFIDDYGDGGTTFHPSVSGLEMFEFMGSGTGNSWDFTVTEPLSYNAWLYQPIIYGYLHTDEEKIVRAEVVNFGSVVITILEAEYSFDGGAPVIETLTGLNIQPGQREIIEFETPWAETTLGTYDLTMTITGINGTADQDPSNNSLTTELVLGNPTPDLTYSSLTGTLVAEFTIIGDENDNVNKPTDIDFHPTLTRSELWLINRGTENSGGSTVIFHGAGTPEQNTEFETDGNAWHFMSLPSALAFGRNGNWASSPSVTDANHSGGAFTGPTLWSSDPDIYAEDSGGNGSHLDMIHQSPNSMGICNAGDNRFYLYDGYNQSICWYDFVKDHGPGNDDHSDGLVRRFAEPVLEPLNYTVPNHMVLDNNTGWLYVCDNGDANPRVLRLNTNTEAEVGEFVPMSAEVLAEHNNYTAEWEEFIIDDLVRPCGIDVVENHLIVGDYQTGIIHIYDIGGSSPLEVAEINTGSDGLAGLKVGPDGKIWYVNYLDNTLVRIDETSVSVPEMSAHMRPEVYPNPASEAITVLFNMNNEYYNQLTLTNALGQRIMSQSINSAAMRVDVSGLEAGVYFMSFEENGITLAREQVIIQK